MGANRWQVVKDVLLHILFLLIEKRFIHWSGK